MEIKRTGVENNAYEIRVDKVKEYKWDVGKASYVGVSEKDIVNLGSILVGKTNNKKNDS